MVELRVVEFAVELHTMPARLPAIVALVAGDGQGGGSDQRRAWAGKQQATPGQRGGCTDRAIEMQFLPLGGRRRHEVGAQLERLADDLVKADAADVGIAERAAVLADHQVLVQRQHRAGTAQRPPRQRLPIDLRDATFEQTLAATARVTADTEVGLDQQPGAGDHAADLAVERHLRRLQRRHGRCGGGGGELAHIRHLAGGRAPLVVHVDLRGWCVVPEVAVCSGKLPGPQARRRREGGHAEPGRKQRLCQRLSNETGRQEGRWRRDLERQRLQRWRERRREQRSRSRQGGCNEARRCQQSELWRLLQAGDAAFHLHDGTAEGFPGLVYDHHLRMIERFATSAGDADQDAVAGFELHRDASIDPQREGVAAVTNVGYLARPVQMKLRQRRLREQFDAGLEDRWLVVTDELRLDAQAGRQQHGLRPLHRERETRASRDSWREPVAQQAHQVGDAVAPLGAAQIGLVGVEILVEAENVADLGGGFDQRDAGVVGQAVRPLGEHRTLVKPRQHVLAQVGVAADAVVDGAQARPVVDRLRESSRLTAIIGTAHRRPPVISKRMRPVSR
ncbi:MAG: hypothetical protein CAPSK01_002435 [Candidatus Accumulibacter vicinus]|uniref:Uncharacterized protein n=1 Tax=Candidatus Accumulibacter vicinus TaxID=2954382 RepID=A0A084XZF3_9PROT|nr:MAG: hypothetical protein CAPSK01_002435 [Candidatus Accumulibacter vicinus]